MKIAMSTQSVLCWHVYIAFAFAPRYLKLATVLDYSKYVAT